MEKSVFQGLTIIKTTKPNVVVHSISSPIEGEMSNAQLIETKSKLLLIDALQLKPHANSLKEYISSIGKPLDRVIVTHYHPDHWFGIASFKDYPIYALQEVIDRINALADFVLNYHRGIHGENADAMIPSEKITPTLAIKEGTFQFDDIEFNLMKITDTEAPCILVPEIPEHKILFAQDLVYNGVHAYFGDKTTEGNFCFDNWINTIKDFQNKNYELVFPGHGEPTDSTIFPTKIKYLEFAKKQIESGKQGENLVNAITAEYPNYLLELTLVMSNYMLFEFKG